VMLQIVVEVAGTSSRDRGRVLSRSVARGVASRGMRAMRVRSRGVYLCYTSSSFMACFRSVWALCHADKFSRCLYRSKSKLIKSRGGSRGGD